MKYFLFIVLLLTSRGDNVIGEGTCDDQPDHPELKISPEELDSLNNLRKDIFKSLNDLKSKMETDNGTSNADSFKEAITKYLGDENYLISDNKTDVKENVDDLATVLDMQMPTLISTYIQFYPNDPGKDKWEEYLETVIPNFQKRLEPFLKYEEDDE